MTRRNSGDEVVILVVKITVTVVGAEFSSGSVASPALETVTTHVPALVALSTSPKTEQAAVPKLVTVKVSAPVPEPPDVVKMRDSPSTALVLVSVSGASAAGVGLEV